ncbi:MAG: hypothetical protein CMJ84_09350 [Planctomycetes bacterium]|jgi:arylsulfatase|nr:hypothetical protein [Planctomycetota bacterium]MDP6410842.1 sulfatase [Planctomycetota bacterium]
MKRIGFLLGALGLAGLAILAVATREDWLDRPVLGTGRSIIIIDIDTLRADHLGHYGYERETSPSFDAFAAAATAFSWAFAQAPFTIPSQTSILTGLYPTHHGRIAVESALPDSVVPLAEMLGEAGYRTAAFVDGGYMSTEYGLGRGFDLYDDRAGGLAEIGPRVEGWLDANAAGEEPFLLLIHSYDVHTPYESSPEPYQSMFFIDGALPSAEFRAICGMEMLRVWDGRNSEEPPSLTEEQLAYLVDLYDGGIRYVDTWLGEFLAGLRERGLFDDALIVFLSDHGEEFLDHGGVMHDKLHTPVTRIPLVIKLPEQREGVEVDAVVESIDVLPTLLEAVGLRAPEGIDGESLLPLVGGRAPAGDRIAVSESPFYGRSLAVATDRHHMLISRRTKRVQLYEFRADPREQADVSAEHPELSGRLAEYALRWHDATEQAAHERKEVDGVRPATLEQLEALGYTGD